MEQSEKTVLCPTDNILHNNISDDIMEYMVWVIEIIAGGLFNNDKQFAYKALKEYGIWDLYIQNYDVTHTLCANYILQEIKEILVVKGVL